MNEYWWKYFEITGKFLVLTTGLMILFWLIDRREPIWQFLLEEVGEKPKIQEKLVDFADMNDEKVGIILEKVAGSHINQVGFGLLINDQQVLMPAHILKSGHDYYFYNNVFGQQAIGTKVFEKENDLALGLLLESVAVKTTPRWAEEVKVNEIVWLWINEEKILKKVEGKIIDLAKRIKLQKVWGETGLLAASLIEVEVQSNLGDSGGTVFNQSGEVIGLLIGVSVENENRAYIMRIDQEKIPLMTKSQ